MTNSSQDPRISNYGIYNKKVIQAVLSMGDYTKYFPAQVRWVGFRQWLSQLDMHLGIQALAVTAGRD